MIKLRTLGAVELTDADGNSLDTVATQSKRFAVLVYLALALPRGWHRRDSLLALFWPELDQTRARHALRQALHFLRKALGEDVIRTRGSEDVAAGPALRCDAVEFEDGDSDPRTLALYQGELLPGFFIRDAAPEWDHWMDERRDALRTRAAKLTERLGEPEHLEPSVVPSPRITRRRRWPAFAAAAALVAIAVVMWMDPQRALARSILADSLYRRGLATLQSQGDNRAALSWFEAALQASPRFPLAAYYAGVSADAIDEKAAQAWFARAQEMLPQASEHDRLLIETAVAFRRDAPEAVVTAESLATRYPGDPLARHTYGATLLWSGDFAGALREFRAELAMTHSHDAQNGIAVSLQFLDSLPASERAARVEVQMAPQSGAAWATLATIQAAEGHVRDSKTSGRRAVELTPGGTSDALGAADQEIRDCDFNGADRMLRDAISYGTSASREQARWLLIISLRNQGRLQEALRYARDYRRANEQPMGLGAVPEAQVLFELGRTDEAGALFDSIAAPHGTPRALASGVEARQESWALAHAAEAWAARGDTARVEAYADTIRDLARRSLYGRDHHLPAHLRGLVWLARGNSDSALTALRSAVFSLSIGYTRTNLELGRVLLAKGHAREAATVATAGLAEAVDGSAYYATRTELHELAARAFDAAGQTDSAMVQYASVVRAWSQSDPMFALRVGAARERLAALHLREHRGLD